MALFLGRYDYAMDDRGRVPIPPRYRDDFARGTVLSQGSPNLCLRVYTIEDFETQAALYLNEPPTRRAGRTARHGVFPNSFHADVDRQGRILIPAALRDFAALEGNVIVVGAGDWLEVWSPDRLDTEMAVVNAELEETLESLIPEQKS